MTITITIPPKVCGLIRHALTTGGGLLLADLVKSGALTSVQAHHLAGVLLVAGGAVWSVLAKSQAPAPAVH